MKPYSTQEALEYKKTRSTWPEVINFYLRYIQSDNFLDAGCGTGNDLLEIYSKKGFVGFGSDKSEEMLAQARSQGCVSTLKQADLDKDFPYDQKFDVIYMHDVIHHLKKPKIFIKNAYDHLNKGGVLIIGSEFHEGLKEKYTSIYFNGAYKIDLKRYYSFQKIKEYLNAVGFKKIDLEKINDYISFDKQIMEQVRTRSHSILHLLENEDFEKGLQKIENDFKLGRLKKMKRDYLLLAAHR